MAKKNSKKDQPYKYREDNQPPQQTGNINDRNNNMNAEIEDEEDNVERANNMGLGDAGWNDEKMTRHTQNHSGDA